MSTHGAITKNMDLYSSTYENFIFLGGFNAGMKNSVLKDFCNLYSLTSLINRPTFWKNHSKFFKTAMLLRQGSLTFIKWW